MKKQLLLLTLMLSVAASASAVEVEIGGLWYDILKKANDAKVIQSKNYPKYNGDIIIPETVEYEGGLCSDAGLYNGNKVSLTGVYKVSVYATKDGYLSSDVSTAEFTMSAGSGKKGDINTDGTVNALDVQEVINIAADTE
jgi:hypothetical protein